MYRPQRYYQISGVICTIFIIKLVTNNIYAFPKVLHNTYQLNCLGISEEYQHSSCLGRANEPQDHIISAGMLHSPSQRLPGVVTGMSGCHTGGAWPGCLVDS